MIHPSRFLIVLCLSISLVLAQTTTQSTPTSSGTATTSLGSPPSGCATSLDDQTFHLYFTNGSANVRVWIFNTMILNDGRMVGSDGKTSYSMRIDTVGQLAWPEGNTRPSMFETPFSVCFNGSVALGSTTNWNICGFGNGAVDINYLPRTYTQPAYCTVGKIIATDFELIPRIPSSTVSTSSSKSTASTSNTSNNATAPTSPTTSNTSSAPTTSASGPSGLDRPSAAAGLAIGVIAGLILIVSAVAFILLRRRKRGARALDATASIEPESRLTAELWPGRNLNSHHRASTWELPGNGAPTVNRKAVPPPTH